MSVKNRILVLNKELQTWLNRRGVEATEEDTTTTLVKKVKNIPLTFNEMSLMPKKSNTTINNYDGIPGVAIQWNDDNSIVYVSQIGGHAWPCITTNYNDTTVQVANLKLFVDAIHSDKFNMMIKWNRRDDKHLQYLRLSELLGFGVEDIAAPRTTKMIDLGSYLVNNCDLTSPPPVEYKYDLLRTITEYAVTQGDLDEATSKNFTYTPKISDSGGQRTYGTHSNDSSLWLMKESIDLNQTPYLYFSIKQNPISEGMSAAPASTFAMYCTGAWFLGFDGNVASEYLNDGAINTNKRTELYSDSNSYSKAKWLRGSMTGCVDMRKYVDPANWSKFNVKGFKFYGYAESDSTSKTECTFNYMFFGSEPTIPIYTNWGDPAYPVALSEGSYDLNQKYAHHSWPAVTGSITIDSIDYYVIGSTGSASEESVYLKAVSIARPYEYT